MKTSVQVLALLFSLLAAQTLAADKDEIPATETVALRCIAFATTLKRSHPSVEAEEGRACEASRTRFPNNSTVAYGYAQSLWNSKQPNAAMKAAKVASELDSADAPVLIGEGFHRGLGPFTNGRDYKQSYRWYKLGLERGSKRAIFYVADAYLHGLGVEQDADLAWKLANLGAQGGDPNAMNLVGHMLMEGRGTAKNPQLGLQFHLKAVDLGSSVAMYNSALCFLEYEMFCGVKKDSARGLMLAKKSADWGDRDGIRLMGDIFRVGNGVTKDTSIAAEWYRKAVALGDREALKRWNRMDPPPSIFGSDREDPGPICGLGRYADGTRIDGNLGKDGICR